MYVYIHNFMNYFVLDANAEYGLFTYSCEISYTLVRSSFTKQNTKYKNN